MTPISLLIIALGLSFSMPAAATPGETLGLDRVTLQNRLTAALDRLEVIAPIGELECKKPGVLRYCSAAASPAVTFGRTETFAGGTTAAQFIAGAPGEVFEVTARLDLSKADDIERERFGGLCAAIAMAAEPSLTPSAAIAQQRKLTIAAANRSGKGHGVATARRGGRFVAVEVWTGSEVACGAHVYGQRPDLLE